MKKSRVIFLAVLLLSAMLVACGEQEAEVDAHAPLPAPESAGGKLMKKFCSQCHAPPQPSVHPADEWSNIIYRMNSHRMHRAMPEIEGADLKVLLAYLEEHAKAP